MTDKDLEKLREQTESSSRIEQDADSSDGAELQAAVVDELEAIDSGETSPNLTMRDANISGLVRGLEKVGRLDEVGAALDEELGNTPGDDYKRADIARLAVRIGLEDVQPELLEDLEDAVAEQIQI